MSLALLVLVEKPGSLSVGYWNSGFPRKGLSLADQHPRCFRHLSRFAPPKFQVGLSGPPCCSHLALGECLMIELSLRDMGKYWIFIGISFRVQGLGRLSFGSMGLVALGRKSWFAQRSSCLLGCSSCQLRSRSLLRAKDKYRRLFRHRFSICSKLVRNKFLSMFFLITSQDRKPTFWRSLRKLGWRCLLSLFEFPLHRLWKLNCWIRRRTIRSLYQVMIYVIQI